jgi:phosphonate transport system substrate-binding protein
MNLISMSHCFVVVCIYENFEEVLFMSTVICNWKITLLSVACFAMLLTLAACGGRNVHATGGGPDGYWPTRIVIGSTASEDNPAAMGGEERLRAAMQEYLGIEVTMLPDAVFNISLEALRAGHLHVMIVSPMSFILAEQLANVVPLVAATTEGARPYKSVFITRADRDDINSIHDLRGKSFAFVDPASSSGYMYPKAHLVTHYGLDPDRILSSGYFFEYVTFSGRHDASIVGVAMGDFDGAAVIYAILYMLSDLFHTDDIKVIGETEIIPPPLMIASGDLPQSLQDALLSFYLQFDDEVYFESRHGNPNIRYRRAYASEYDVIAATINALNLQIGN